jgi:tRNA threonylcarbamoyladenosine biosynthesis protein TsaB
MEVYYQVNDAEMNEVESAKALIVDETSVQVFSKYNHTLFFGSGMQKCVDVLKNIAGAEFLEGIETSAENMNELSFKKFQQKAFENTAYCEPLYVKEFYTPAKPQKE